MSPFGEWRSQAAPTCTVRVWMAGDYDDARRFLRRYCAEHGACFAVQRATYVYSGGEEAGLCISLINYPRFPKAASEIADLADGVARRLAEYLGQVSYSIERPDGTVWHTRRPA